VDEDEGDGDGDGEGDVDGVGVAVLPPVGVVPPDVLPPLRVASKNGLQVGLAAVTSAWVAVREAVVAVYCVTSFCWAAVTAFAAAWTAAVAAELEAELDEDLLELEAPEDEAPEPDGAGAGAGAGAGVATAVCDARSSASVWFA
jgi:hypothetical protein